jgi:hypothetical protein
MSPFRARRAFCGVLATGLLAAAASRADSFSDMAKSLMAQPAAQSALSDSDIAAGLKQALAKGTTAAVNELGRSGGFWDNPRFRIPLPSTVEKIENMLQGSGMGNQLDDLHLSFNRAAEQAVPVAADVFGEAVQKLSLDDVRGILNGPQDAATQYFRRATSDTLTAKFKPIVSGITAKVGLAQKYNNVMGQAGPMASMLGGGNNLDLNDYVTRKTLDGLFVRVGDEEKSIRSNPAARTTELMQKVFGSK